MIKVSSETKKIRLVGLFCSRDYFHEFAIQYILFQLKSIETFLMWFIG